MKVLLIVLFVFATSNAFAQENPASANYGANAEDREPTIDSQAMGIVPDCILGVCKSSQHMGGTINTHQGRDSEAQEASRGSSTDSSKGVQ